MTRYFLEIELARSSSGIILNSRKYVLDILADVGLTGAKFAAFPLPKGLHLSAEHGDLLEDPGPFRRLIGRSLYLTLTSLDISYSVQHLSQFLQQPRLSHYQAALHVLRYLKGSANRTLFLSSS